MTKAPSSLQDLRRSLYVKAKAESTWRFWGLYVHVCKMETLYEAYRMAKENGGAPGIDGVTFEAIEESGVESLQSRKQTLRKAQAGISQQMERLTEAYLIAIIPIGRVPTAAVGVGAEKRGTGGPSERIRGPSRSSSRVGSVGLIYRGFLPLDPSGVGQCHV